MEKINKYLVVLLIAMCSAYTLDGFAQVEADTQREVVIVKKMIDENGVETMTKETYSGDEISDADIERLIDIDMDGAEVEIEMEETIERPTLGVKISKVSGGLKVLEVVEDSPAAEAGIRAGDIITAVGEQQVASLDELNEALDQQGQTPVVNLLRDGSYLAKKVTLEKMTKTVKKVKKSVKKTSTTEERSVKKTIEKKEVKVKKPKNK